MRLIDLTANCRFKDLFSPFFGGGGGPGGRLPPRVLPGWGGGAGGLPPFAGLLVRLEEADAGRLVIPLARGRGGGSGAGGGFLLGVALEGEADG